MATPVVPSNTARVQLIDEFGVVYKATGGGSSVEIQVEGVDNASQTLVNFVSGTPANCTISNPSGGIVQFDITAAGTGDVVGPASAVNADIAVFNGITGKLIADGGTTIAAINSSIAGKLSTVTADAPLSGSGTSGSHLVISQAGAATNGYLSSIDWNTFNNKQAAGSYLTTVTADAPLSGSGTSGSHLVIADAAADGTTKGAATFTASDFNAASGVISIDYTNGQAADATHKGFLTSADWSTFNAKQPAGSYLTAVTADAPLSGSGTSGSHLVAAVFVGSGASHATGIVPDPGASAGTTKFLREDATWAVPAGGGGSGDIVATLVNAENSITTTANAVISTMNVISGTSANYTVTLPAASGNTGKLLGIRVLPTATKLFTIDGNASETIDGALTRIMWAGESAILLCDGSNWFKIAGKTIPMMAQMHLSASQTGIPSATTTKIDVDTTDLDTTGAMADTTNKKIIIRRPGYYGALGEVRITSMSAAGISSPGVQLNGSAVSAIAIDQVPISGTSAISALATFQGAAGDSITLAWYQGSGGNQDAYGDVLANGPCLLIVREIPTW